MKRANESLADDRDGDRTSDFASIVTYVPSCSFCRRIDSHEPWCQVSPEWIALEAVFSVADGISEVTTIETLYSLAKLRPDTECLTLEMVRELVHAWAELGEWEDVGGRYRRLA